MRVLIVIDSLVIGGAERSLATLAPRLIERGVELHVGHLSDRHGLERTLQDAGVIIHSLAGRGGRLGRLGRTMGLARAIHPDLIHTTLYEADLAGRTAGWLLGIPVVSSFVSEPYGADHIHNPDYRAWKVRAAQLADAVTARFVTRFHSVSASAADVMPRRLLVDRDRIEVIPRGREPAELGVRTPERRRDARARLGVYGDEPLVLGAGRHWHVKGFDVLIEAFRSVADMFPGARLLIAGREGPATEQLANRVVTLGLEQSVTLAGFRADLAELMCAADVFAFPSRSEGSPGVLLEAMALETPVVASDIPSVRELAGEEDETMVLVPPDSPEDFGKAISDLLADLDRCASLATAARKRFISQYTMGAIADATADLYRRVAADRNRAR